MRDNSTEEVLMSGMPPREHIEQLLKKGARKSIPPLARKDTALETQKEIKNLREENAFLKQKIQKLEKALEA